jgi:ribosomal protein L40E
MDQGSPTSTPPAAQTCPSCGAAASGRFCSACGAAIVGVACTSCGAQLTPGAKFCHRCGTAAGRAARDERSFSSALPWGVAAITLVALIALFAGQRFGRSAGDDAAQNQTAAAPAGAAGQPPDLSSMTPEDAAARLYDRVMSLHERGRADSVQMFAPMAMQAYEMLGKLNLDQRYDLGRIAAVAGDSATARAQADTILAQHPNHLLGLILAGNAARMRKDVAAERGFHDQLVAAAPAERAKQLAEYTTHENDITIALDAKRP